MIDREQFAKVMGAFAERVGRTLSPLTAEMYLDILDEALTTEEFLVGARVVFKSHQYATWPAPQQFIDAAKPPTSVALDAAEMYQKVTKAVGTVYTDHAVRTAALAALGPVAERAYRAAGGYRAFVNVLEKDEPFLRKRFMEVYGGARESSEKYEAIGPGHAQIAELIRGVADTKALPSGRDLALPTGDRE